ATPIDFSRKLDCCGFHAVYPAHDSVMQMTGSINKDAATEGADCVVTPCPLCQMQLDMFQKEAKEVVGGGKDMPILHMSQLVGLALGISPAEMGMPKRHLTDTAAVTKFVG
ncbi:heterodisulfide reductase-related iron-sulfur binding cluster, partial [Veillonella parvula]